MDRERQSTSGHVFPSILFGIVTNDEIHAATGDHRRTGKAESTPTQKDHASHDRRATDSFVCGTLIRAVDETDGVVQAEFYRERR